MLESYEGIVDIETQSYGCILFLRNGSSVYGLVEDFASGCPNAAAVGRGDTWAIAPEMLEPVDPTSLERLLLERVRKNISNLKRNEKALPAVYYRIKTK